jgi:hypothetical protein
LEALLTLKVCNGSQLITSRSVAIAQSFDPFDRSKPVSLWGDHKHSVVDFCLPGGAFPIGKRDTGIRMPTPVRVILYSKIAAESDVVDIE